jgi:hypothetical protein
MWERRGYIKPINGLQMVWKLFCVFYERGFCQRREAAELPDTKADIQAPDATVRMHLATER